MHFSENEFIVSEIITWVLKAKTVLFALSWKCP